MVDMLFYKMVDEQFAKNNHQVLMDVGTCALYTVVHKCGSALDVLLDLNKVD